jgi:hypothetical protein
MINPKTILNKKPEITTVVWSIPAGETPTGPPLAAEDWLLVPTHEAVLSPSWSHLRWFGLADGRPGSTMTFEGALIIGIRLVRFPWPGDLCLRPRCTVPARDRQDGQKPDRSKTSGGSILVAIYSADAPGDKGSLVALNAAGEELWRWMPGVHGVSAPALVNQTAWVTTNTGFLVSLDVATGAQGARILLGTTPSLSAPLVIGEVAYIPCRGPRLLAVGLDGQRRWELEVADHPQGWLNHTPVVAGEYLVAVLNRVGRVIALRLADGEPAWQIQVGPAGKDLSPPVTDGERLYVGTRQGLHTLGPADGHELWHFPVERGVAAAPVVVGGVVYIACRDHHLYALDSISGQELWCYEVERRIEVPPLITASARPLAAIADRGGTITALRRPLSAAEHEAAGQWAEAAATYAALGQPSRAAELLEAHGESFKAAQLWQATGDLERAAGQYELAGAWPEAADLWGQLDRSLKQAEALEQHARSLVKETASDEVRADAWANAAEAFEAAGEDERAGACRREVARCRHLPYLAVDVNHENLVLNAWTRLSFIVHNQGSGPARQLIIRARGGQFEGQVAKTRQIMTLRVGQKREDWLDIRPLAYGDSVPLRVSIEYQDRTQTSQTWWKTLYLPVAQSQVTQEKPMAGISPDIYRELRDALLDCDPFESNRKLRDVFAVTPLRPWRNNVPEADSRVGRVDAVIGYLHDKYNRDGANALALLLKVLRGQIDPEDARHQRLARLAEELEGTLGRGTPPTQRPASIGGRIKHKPSSQPLQSGAQQAEPLHPGDSLASGQLTAGGSYEKPQEAEKKDFFVSYNRADREWAEWIAWQLEEEGYTTIIQAWDFRPGGNFVIDMQRAADQARRTIAVLSPDYLQALYTYPEWAAAFAQDPTGEKGTLLPVRVRECELKGLLPQIVYIDLVGLDQEAAKQELVAGVKQGRAKPAIAPSFPGAVKHTTSERPDFPGGASSG